MTNNDGEEEQGDGRSQHDLQAAPKDAKDFTQVECALGFSSGTRRHASVQRRQQLREIRTAL